ncbi:MAG: response regulator [Acidobacteria bacterium]|nr:response regulator [Acidobacteriota bacterium]
MAMKVLVIDDSSAMRKFIQRAIKTSGADVEAFLEAADGAAALEVLSGNAVDMIFCDLNMPNMDGETFVAKKMLDERIRSIPVVIVSTDSSRDRVRSLIGNGVAGYVEKPFQPEDLRKELDRVMASA